MTTPRYQDTPLERLHKYGECVKSFLNSKSDHTLDAYQRDIMRFADFFGIKRTKRFDIEAATRVTAELLSKSAGEAYKTVLAYRTTLLKEDGRAPKTVDRRISTLRSLVKTARTLGLVRYNLEISNLGDGVVRDTKGPEEDGVRRMMKVIIKRYARGNFQEKRKALRDRAILRLMYDRAFRRMDVVQLNIESVDFDKKRAWVKRKGRAQAEPWTLATATLAAVKAWIKVRGEAQKTDPLFVGIYRDLKDKRSNQRLNEKSVYNVIRGIGAEAGIKTWPHALRHAAVTEALNKTNGDLRAVAKFAGHKNPTTTMIYDDNRKDLGGQVAEKVAGDL